jgi:signal transduction histidine kinase
MQKPSDIRRSSHAYLAAMFFAPTGLIVVVGIVLMLSLLKASALRLDQSQQNAELRLARSVMATLVTNLQKSVADYANWDDMYDQFSTGPNPQWVKENLGPYATDAFTLSHILVLGTDGSIRYAFMSRTADASPDPAEIGALGGLVQKAMGDWRPGVIKATGGAARMAGRPHLVAISPIAVNSATRKALGGTPQAALMFLIRLDEPRLAALASDFGLTGLRATAGAEGDFPLVDPLGQPSGFSLTWNRSQLGSDFVSDAIPSILLVGAIVLLLVTVLGSVWALIIGRIREAATVAEEASRSKGLFIANMTHELRTPLNAVIGFSELIAQEKFGPIGIPKYKEYAHDIVSSGHHLLGVVNNILLFSKLEARRQEVNIDRLDLTEAVSDVVRVMQAEAGRRNVKLIEEPFPEMLMVDSDSQALKQILFNLLGNAIKFSSAGETVRVVPVGTTADRAFKLQIVDSGCGIPANVLSQLGNAFVQADNTFARKHQGTGLGLAICFGLAKQIRASIQIASTENVGTTVSLLLPMSDLKMKDAGSSRVQVSAA